MELTIIALLLAVFVGVNVGGSNLGVSFGPVVGSGVISVRKAAGLMSFFAILGGVLIGPNVIETLGKGIIPQGGMTTTAALGVMLFTGLGLAIGNYAKVSVSTSKIAVISVAALGFALSNINLTVLTNILIWWVFSGLIAFWLSAMIGRYLFDSISNLVSFGEEKGKYLIIGVACYAAFSAGANNVANIIAPVIGSGQLTMTTGLIISLFALTIGAFWIGPRTTETIGFEITDINVEVAILIQAMTATVITVMSILGIPASLAHIAVLTTIGIAWGRATNRVEVSRALGLKEMRAKDVLVRKKDSLNLFNYETAEKILLIWVLSPVIIGIISLLVFFPAVHYGII